ncbi:MAG: lipid-A-disaccharide synthase [Thiomargarita sp.]|nr:lipid-A-disaccharide synthase [Thiomargarita sp.]
MRIAIIAGELSGDILGAGLIQAIREHYPNAIIEGIGGSNMLAAGFNSHYPLNTLSVMGLIEVLKHYPQLKKCRNNLRNHFLQQRPDIFIGIDAPDFNLGLELQLKTAGIKTVHYVSPSVWAWRQYRLNKIAAACDLMLTLFPFEAQYYQQHKIPVQFVGHPLADKFPITAIDKIIARKKLNLTIEDEWIALLPGSRQQEVEYLGPSFLRTAHWLLTKRPDLKFIVPLPKLSLIDIFRQQMAKLDYTLPLRIIEDNSYDVMSAADVILTASGTATLEAMLLKRPMVVAYRMSGLTYQIAKRLVKIPYFALPNLLAEEKLVPEFLQSEVTPENLGTACICWLDNLERTKSLTTSFTNLHQQLRLNANQQAANAVLSLIK